MQAIFSLERPTAMNEYLLRGINLALVAIEFLRSLYWRTAFSDSADPDLR
jgi:hypothetical protein